MIYESGKRGRRVASISRRDLLCVPLLSPLALAASSSAQVAQPGGVKRLRITKVHTVEVRGVPAGKGLVLPWDAKRTPLDTRDYVVTQFVTDQGLVGTTMDGDYRLPSDIGRMVQERAEAYFLGKDPMDIELHNAQFFQKQKAPVRLFFLEVGLWDLVGKVCGQPLYKLWGAHSEKIRAYAATVHFDRTPAQRAEDALRFYERGFRAIKLRMHHDSPADDLALVAEIGRASCRERVLSCV
jgi:D-galactarolactone cycloisomerase